MSKDGKTAPLSRSAVRTLGLCALTAGAYHAGTIIGNGREAHAADEQKVNILDRLQVPAVAIPKGGAALIGASDDRYYLVQQDGTVVMLTGLQKEDLCWRRVEERTH